MSKITDDLLADIGGLTDGTGGILTGLTLTAGTLPAVIRALTALDARLDALELRTNGVDLRREAGERIED